MEIRDADTINQVQTLQNLQVDDMLKSLDLMHKEVAGTLSDSRTQAVNRHNRKTHVRSCNPSVGDYVVLARTSGPRTKMSANWVGPRRVSKVLSDFTVEIEHLLTGETLTVHVSRIKMYADNLVGMPASLEDVATYSSHSIDFWSITMPVPFFRWLRQLPQSHFFNFRSSSLVPAGSPILLHTAGIGKNGTRIPHS